MTNISLDDPNRAGLDLGAPLDVLRTQASVPQIEKGTESRLGHVHGVRGRVKRRVMDRFYDNPCHSPREMPL